MSKHIAVIPARGGSKGLRRKNVLPLAGLPTITYTIRAAQRSELFDEIIVVSDSDEILGIAADERVRTMRESDEMAGDTVSSTVPVLWVVDELEDEFDFVWNLQPTSPLRTPNDLIAAARALDENPDADFLASVTPIDPHYFHWALKREGDYSELWFPDFLVDRSLLPPVFRPNGAIKVGRPDRLAEAGSVFAPKMITSEIEDHRSIHIRAAWDLELAEFVVEKYPQDFAWVHNPGSATQTVDPRAIGSRGVAVITGGCNDFGLTIAAALEDRYDVVLTTRSTEKAAAFSTEHGVDARALDLGDFDAIEQFFASFDRLDCLVNAAVARFGSKDNAEYSWPEWERELEINIGATYKASVEAAKVMSERGFGRIVNIGSIYGSVAVQHNVYPEGMGHTHIVYSASKAAVVHMTRELAVMWAEQGVTVNCVSFGGIAAGQPEEFVRNYNAKVPMGRMGTYEELGPALRLATDPQNSYMTGQELMVDGGLTVW